MNSVRQQPRLCCVIARLSERLFTDSRTVFVIDSVEYLRGSRNRVTNKSNKVVVRCSSRSFVAFSPVDGWLVPNSNPHGDHLIRGGGHHK